MLTRADYDRNLLRKKIRCLRTSHRSFCSRLSVLSLGRARAFGRVESAARGSYDSGSAESGPRKYTRVAWPDLLSIMRTRRACRATMYTACRTRTELLACACGDTMACLLRGGVRCKFDQMHIPATFLLDGGWVRSRNFRLKHSDPPYQPDTHQGAPRTSRSHCQHRGVNCWLRRCHPEQYMDVLRRYSRRSTGVDAWCHARGAACALIQNTHRVKGLSSG